MDRDLQNTDSRVDRRTGEELLEIEGKDCVRTKGQCAMRVRRLRAQLTVRIIHHGSEDGMHHIADECGQARDLRSHVSLDKSLI